MNNKRQLIYKDYARRAVLKANPSVVYCIDRLKSVDAVEVVRCKDCKYLMFSDCYGECWKGRLGIVKPNDFCSYGERKE